MALLDDKQRRILVGISVWIMSASFIPWMSGYVSGVLNWKIGSTEFTLGTLFALIGIYAGWQIMKREL